MMLNQPGCFHVIIIVFLPAQKGGGESHIYIRPYHCPGAYFPISSFINEMFSIALLRLQLIVYKSTFKLWKCFSFRGASDVFCAAPTSSATNKASRERNKHGLRKKNSFVSSMANHRRSLIAENYFQCVLFVIPLFQKQTFSSPSEPFMTSLAIEPLGLFNQFVSLAFAFTDDAITCSKSCAKLQGSLHHLFRAPKIPSSSLQSHLLPAWRLSKARRGHYE